MPILILVFATLNAVLAGYQLSRAFDMDKGDPARTGNLIFAALSTGTAFTLALTVYLRP